LFWFLTACLFILAALFLIAPLWFRNRAQSFEFDTLRKNENIALFHERSNELESDLATGDLDQRQFDALMLELQQSLLADVSAEDAEEPTATAGAVVKKSEKRKKGSSNTNRGKLASNAVPIILALLIPVFSYGLYSQWGYIDDVEMMGLFERTVNNADNPEESQSLIVSLGQAVQEDQDRLWAWYFLAENFASLGMFSEAEIGYQQAAARMDDSPDKAFVLGKVAMVKYFLAEFKLTEEIQEVIRQAQAINPGETSILQLLAADADERQDYNAAIEYWRLLIQGNPSSQQAQLLRENIAAAQQLLIADGQDVDLGPVIEINLSLAEGIEIDENLRVFVAARNAAREGLPPVAATDLTVGDLPSTIRLDNSSAVGPFNLSSADAIYVSALISYSGTANPGTGDYRVQSENFAHNGQHAVINLVISEQLP
jgi:cytochrome c-type biogenesis protein CcmH